MDRYYITYEDIETARANGISYSLLYNRVWILGWDIERAIKLPPRTKQELPKVTKDILKEKGISHDCFRHRIKSGWEYKKALNTPTLSTKETSVRALSKKQTIGFTRKRIITDEQIEIAKNNGISYHTLRYRIKFLDWDIDRATTEPINNTKNKKQKTNHSWKTDNKLAFKNGCENEWRVLWSTNIIH